MRTDLPALLRSARPGDVIELPPGEYDGEFVVDQPVELRPLDGPGTVTLSSSTGNTLMLLADATVRELTVVGKAWGAAAIEVAGRVAPRIRNCDVSAPGHIAIRVRAGARPEVTGCRIGGALHGLRVESAGGEYRRCEFVDTGLDSVVAESGADVLVADSRFVRQGGHAARAERGGALTLRDNIFEVGPVAAIKASGRIGIFSSTVHGGSGSAVEIDDGVLRADRVRVENVGAEGVLVSGGEGLFTSCRFTGTHGPAVWMMGGRARFDECEAIDSDRDGFLVVGGEADFFRCVAHNNAGQGFSLLHKASIAECSSFGNGRPDEIGQPVVQRSEGPTRRVGVNGYRTIYEALQAADAGDVIEIDPGEYAEAVSFDKRVEVRPAGSPGSVRVSAGEPNVLGLGGGATLRDIVLSGSIWVAGEALLQKCEIADGRVTTRAGSALSLRDCEVRADMTANGALTMIGCTVIGSRGVGVMHAESVADLRDCVLDDVTEAAIYVGDGRVTISNVRVRRARNGLQLYNGTVEATGLTVADSTDHGIEVYGGMGSFSDCTVTNAGSQGVLVCGGDNAFEQCRAIGNGGAGFEIAFGTTKLTRCVAKDNRHLGFFLYDDANVTVTEC